MCSRPEHKLTCSHAPDNNMTIRLGRHLPDHLYFHTHLLLYAIRAIGPPKLPDDDHNFLLMAVVHMVPLLSSRTGKKHIIVKNILAVPVCIVPQEVVDTQLAALRTWTHRKHSAVHCVWIATTGVYPEGEESRFRLTVLDAAEIMISSAHLPNFSLDLPSHSHNTFRRLNLNMDFLFE